MVKQLTFSLLLFMAVIACADDYIFATGRDGTEIVYTADRMIYTNWLSDCVLWMPFPSDVGGGSYPDYSKEQNDGSQSTVTNRPTWSSGSYDFDGVSEYIDCGNDASLDVTGDYSIACWIRVPTDITKNEVIAGRNNDGGNDGFMLRVLVAGDIAQFLHILPGKGFNGIYSLAAVDDGEWHCLIGIFEEGVGSEFFIDDVSQGTDATVTTAITAYTPDFRVGAQDYEIVPRHYTGEIDDVRLYNIALTSNQVNQIYLDTKGAH